MADPYAGLLGYGLSPEDLQKQRQTDMGLLGLITGASILANNQPGVGFGQSVGQGVLTGANAYMAQEKNREADALKRIQAAKLVGDIEADKSWAAGLKNGTIPLPKGADPALVSYLGPMGREKGAAALAKAAIPQQMNNNRYYVVPTSQGMMSFDKVTGKWSFLTNDGGQAVPPMLGATVPAPDGETPAPPPAPKPVLPISADPKLKGEMSRAGAEGSTVGTASGKAKIDLQKLEADSQYMLDLLDKVTKTDPETGVVADHPGFSGVVGLPSVSGLLRIPATQEANFRVLMDQIKGKQFMEAYNTLKGGGQITEIEGTKATDAMARMNTAQTEEEFRSAVNEFKGIIKRGIDRARAQAGGAASAPRPTTNNPVVVDW